MTARPDWATFEPTAHIETVMGRPLSQDEITYVWEFDTEGQAVCVLQYYEQERGGFAHPDMVEQVVLQSVYVGDTDIEIILSYEQRRRIERLALDDLRRERRRQECVDFDGEDA